MLFDIFRYMQSPVRSFSLLDGDPLASATLQHVLGSGRHGTVFLAQLGEKGKAPRNLDIDENEEADEVIDLRTEPQSMVAIKIAGTDSDVTAEVEALQTLAHPHIVRLISAEPPSTIAVEYCSGGTLNDLIVSASLSLHELRYVFQGVTAALEHIHDSGWVHGDISPSNIGIRPVGGAALFDFSTARLADGEELLQGTEEWAGPHRVAVPSFDVRCAAAIARRALDRGSIEPSIMKTLANLDSIVEQIDGGDVATVDELRVALGLGTTSRIPSDMAQRVGAGGAPPMSTTRDFGPRPGGQGGSEEQTSVDSRSNVVLALAVAAILVTISALAIEFLRHAGTDAPEAFPSILTERVVAAESTLVANNAIWDHGSGTRTITRTDGPEIWKVGEPGDLAAIGDWNCNGIETLGVLRPTDGTWFTFSNWSAGASSTVEHLASETPMSALDVRVRVDGCAQPLAG